MIPLLIAPESVSQFAALTQAKRNRRLLLTDGQVVVDDGSHRPLMLAQKLSDGTAIIPITAELDYRWSWLCYYGYYVSTQQVRQEFAALLADDQVKRIVFDIDSPGGVYSGIPELGRDIFASRGQKTTIAVANPMAASGALWVGAACEKFLVLGSGMAGSLGALMLHTDLSRYYDQLGIVNTILRKPDGKADFNSLEPLSDESRKIHQDGIDAIADEFLTAMAKYRGVSKSAAAKDFGQGRMLAGKDAVAAGLCDGLVDSLDTVVGGKSSKKRARLHPRLELALAAAAGKTTKDA